MKQKLERGQKIFFMYEKLPYEIKAISEKFAVVTRKLNKKEDDDILEFEVERGAYSSKKDAYNSIKKYPVYSLIDFTEKTRARNNMVFNPYDYELQEDIDQCLLDLENGEVDLSHRNKVDLNIDWSRTSLTIQP